MGGDCKTGGGTRINGGVKMKFSSDLTNEDSGAVGDEVTGGWYYGSGDQKDVEGYESCSDCY